MPSSSSRRTRAATGVRARRAIDRRTTSASHLPPVEARYQLLQARRRFDPTADDPLFRSIDADDFEQDFTTLRTKALVRVVLPLPANVRLADDPTATSVAVFRSVPTVVNARFTAPFQGDGRLGTLPEQALSAMRAHSEITADPNDRVLRRLAAFQEHLFSSVRTRNLARALASGEPLPNTDPPLNALERQGKATFTEFCATCHGGATQTVNTDARFLPVPQRGPLLATIVSLTPSGRRLDAREIDALHALACAESARFDGGPIERVEHGIVIPFAGPGRAIECGHAIATAAAQRDMSLSIGVHAGECELVSGTVRGLAVEIAGRIAQRARTGEVLVSRTVVDLVAGSGLRFTDRGEHRLTDHTSRWQVFGLEQEHSRDEPAERLMCVAQ